MTYVCTCYNPKKHTPSRETQCHESSTLILYIRYSSERQGKGNSIERQKSYIAEMAKQIAAEYDLEIFEEYEDLGCICIQG